MNYRQLVSRGLGYLRRGELSPVATYVRSAAGSRFADQLDDQYVRTFTDGNRTVPWVTMAGDPAIVRIDDHHVPEYRQICRGDGGDQRIDLDPPDPFTSVTLDVVDAKAASALTVELSAETVDGGTETQRQRFSGGILTRLRGSAAPRSLVPVNFDLAEPAVSATVELIVEELGRRPDTGLSRLAGLLAPHVRAPDGARSRWKTGSTPWLSVPSAPAATRCNPPIVVISIDTFRQDALAHFDEALEALGPDAVVPAEPRTKGHWTRPSHGSLFTGTHPGHHGYPRHVPGSLNPDLTTLGELLAANQYRCSACVTSKNLGPEWGFGRGFHRYEATLMSHHRREHGAEEVVETALDWLDRDTPSEGSLCYFLHVLDPHYPYVPPEGHRDGLDLDVTRYESTLDRCVGPGDYLAAITGDRDPVEEDDIDAVRALYERCVEYTSRQLARFFDALDDAGLFEEAFIVVTGDHGEDFFEHGIGGHRSLYDPNIRPGMVVKPPAGSDVSVPDRAATTDVLPTVARLVGERVPEQCCGTPWQEPPPTGPRIIEALEKQWYLIAVEDERMKAIFTFDTEYPGRPTPSQVRDGPVYAEWFELPSDRTAEVSVDAESIPAATRKRFRNASKTFVRDQPVDDRLAPSVPYRKDRVTEEVDQRLTELGYK